MIKYRLFAVLALAAVLLLIPGVAEAEGVALVSELNFGGTDLHQSTWNRLEVTVLNEGGGDLQGTVAVRAGGQFVQDVFIESGKRETVVFYLPPAEVLEGWSGVSPALEISVRDHKGRELERDRLNVSMYGPQFTYAGALGGTAKNFFMIGLTLPQSHLTNIGPEYLDNLAFAENFSVIAINDPDTISLSAGQEENLRRWVEQGGVLVLGGGSGWQRTANLVPDDLLPVLPQGAASIAAADLAALNLPVLLQGEEYTAAVGDVRGTVLLEAAGTPLLVRKALGDGAVLWSALDLSAAPLDNPGNNEAFWEQILLFQPALSRTTQQKSWAVNQLFNSLSQDSLASALSPLKIFLLLLAYIILAGPVNWLVLRKLDRREWAWLTIPVLAVLFTTGAFAAGRMGRGTERVLYQLNLINVHSEGLAGISSYSGVFVPRRGRITLTAPVSALAPQEGGAVTLAKGQSSIVFRNPPLWSVQRFYASEYKELTGNFAVTAELGGLTAKQLKAEVVNNSGHELFDSYIRLGDNWYSVGPLQAGEKKSINAYAEPMLNFGPILQRYSPKTSLQWYELNELLPNSPLAFIGFGDEGQVPVDGAGKSVALDIWIQRIDMDSMDFSAGSISIPKGMLTPVLQGGTGSERWGDEYNFEGQGSFDLLFTFPPGLDYSQGKYLLNLYNIWGEARGSLTVFNHVQGEWQELTSLDSLYKSQPVIALENPAELIRSNRLTVRINYDGYLGLSLKGVDITVEGGEIHD